MFEKQACFFFNISVRSFYDVLCKPPQKQPFLCLAYWLCVLLKTGGDIKDLGSISGCGISKLLTHPLGGSLPAVYP